MSHLPPLFGRSAGFRRLRVFLERAAGVDAAVLLQGETGTGKTLVARHIHAMSHRASRPFVAVNCAAIPESLFESELFGHARGAFTGAHADRVGLVAGAERGTLFLDEVGDLPASQQAKLLTAVEERRIRPVGASRTVEVDFRLVSASCRPLSELRADGFFRDDLYHRIALLAVTLPPLRERVADILPLARRFLGAAIHRHALGERVLDPGLREVLEAYPWPGNVRQLAHVVEAAAILAEDARIGAEVVAPLLVDAAAERSPHRWRPSP